MGFGVASTAPKSPGLMSPRRSEGVRWVPLTEQALAAADFQESRRALWPLDANSQQAFAMKEGRTPAFASRPDNVLSPQTAVKKSPSMESLMPQQLPQSLKRLPQSGSVAQLNMMQAQRALSACLPKAAEKRSTMGPGDAIVCERMLPELAADNVMWCAAAQLASSGARGQLRSGASPRPARPHAPRPIPCRRRAARPAPAPRRRRRHPPPARLQTGTCCSCRTARTGG